MINRYFIPKLESSERKIGEVEVFSSSLSIPSHDFKRYYQNDVLNVEIEFFKEYSNPNVVMYTNINGRWGDLFFERVSKNKFKLNISLKKCGTYHFKIGYCLEDHGEWYWDKDFFSRIMVDPSHTDNIKMYTLIPTVSGKLSDWKNITSNAKELGFNFIHLLPITKLDTSESPYSANDLFNIDNFYLDDINKNGLDQLEDYFEFAKEKGMRICTDLVLNHIGVDSKMAKICPNWIVEDYSEKDGMQRTGCWHMGEWLKWEDLLKINFNHPNLQTKKEIWAYMFRYASFWANYANETGGMIRLDNLHSSDQAFVTWLTLELRRAFPNLIIQAEYFADYNTLMYNVPKLGLNVLLGNPWDHPYAENLRNYIKYIHETSDKFRYITPITTHDSGAPKELFGSVEATIPRYFIAAMFTTGQTGIVQGVENGVEQKIKFIGKNPKLELVKNEKLHSYIKKINKYLDIYPDLRKIGNLIFVDNNHGAILAAYRKSSQEGIKGFILLANLDIHSNHTIELDKELNKDIEDSSLFELFTEKKVKYDDLKITLKPCEIKLIRIDSKKVV
jgi:hypothetical protein